MICHLSSSVGMRRFELPTPRPPGVYSNRTELHPDDANLQNSGFDPSFFGFHDKRP